MTLTGFPTSPTPSPWSAAREARRPSRLRRLGPADRDALERHLIGLDRADRYARFQASVTDAAIASYVRGLDLRRVIIVGAFDERGELIGLAEAHLSTARPFTAEVAVSVASDWRHCGLGHDV